MKVRDLKAGILGEALQGLRQVKFSALEDEWEEAVMEQREIEIDEIWGVLRSKCGMIACW